LRYGGGSSPIDQRLQIGPAGIGDVEAVRRNEFGGHLALDVGDLGQRRIADFQR
jgi:hypothetical protein